MSNCKQSCPYKRKESCSCSSEIKRVEEGIITLVEEVKSFRKCICESLETISSKINIDLEPIIKTLDKIDLTFEKCSNIFTNCALFEKPDIKDSKLIYKWSNFDTSKFSYGIVHGVFTPGSSNNLFTYIDNGGDTLLKVRILGSSSQIKGFPTELAGQYLKILYSPGIIDIYKTSE